MLDLRRKNATELGVTAEPEALPGRRGHSGATGAPPAKIDIAKPRRTSTGIEFDVEVTNLSRSNPSLRWRSTKWWRWIRAET